MKQMTYEKACEALLEIMDPKLDAPAMVGAGTFCKGVSWKHVIRAAQNNYKGRNSVNTMCEQMRWQPGFPPPGVRWVWLTLLGKDVCGEPVRFTVLAVKHGPTWYEATSWNSDATGMKIVMPVIAWMPYILPQPFSEQEEGFKKMLAESEKAQKDFMAANGLEDVGDEFI